MKSNAAVLMGLAIVLVALVSGCTQPTLPRTITAAELLENAESNYGKQVHIHGEVSELGEVLCTCFRLTSGGRSVQVWYDSMVTDDGTEMPAVSVEGISNGQQVVVTGVLQRGTTHASPNDFWARSIGGGEPTTGNGDEERHICSDDERNADACIEIYQPACGWFDPEKVQCVSWPCASTYGNSCFACMDENIAYWTEGDCPSSQPDGDGNDNNDANEMDISSFDECVAAGNPILESYPRQCLTEDGRSFVEILESKQCSTDQDCVVMGQSGNCNCGCFNMNYDEWESGGACFCAAPTSCECVNGECQGDFGDGDDSGDGGDDADESVLTGEQARAIAEAEASSCVENGTIDENGTISYNQVTRTWWFDLTPDTDMPGCSPACVVWEETNVTEINWRCTGLL